MNLFFRLLPSRLVSYSANSCFHFRHPLWGLLLLLSSLHPAIGATRLNDSIPGLVSDYLVSNDGQRVVFVTRDLDGYRVFSKELAGQVPPVLLNEGVIRDNYGAIEISPDSQWVVMRLHDGSMFNSQDVFTRRIDGSGNLTNLTGDLTAINYASARATFQITPDSNQIVVNARKNGVDGIYSGRIDGSTGLTLIGSPPPPRTDIESFSLAAHRPLVYQSYGAFSVPIDSSSTPVKLTGDLRVIDLNITPDGSRIVFRSQPSVWDPWTFYSAPADGSGPIVTLGGPTKGFNLGIGDQSKMSQDGSQLIFVSDEDNRDQFELYRRNIDGSGPLQKLNAPLPLDGDVSSFQLSPDNQWIIYHETIAGSLVDKVFLARTDGTEAPAELPFPTPDGYRFSYTNSSPDSRNLLYVATRTELSSEGLGGRRMYSLLFSRPIDGGSPEVLLSSNVSRNESIADFRVTPDGEYVVFGKDRDGAFYELNFFDWARNHELYAVPIRGGVPQLVNDPLTSDVTIHAFSFTPDGKSILYRTDLSNPRGDLYLTTLPVPEPSYRVFTPIALFSMIVYTGRTRFGNRENILSVRT